MMFLSVTAAAETGASLVVRNAVVRTFDSRGTVAQALAVVGERIVFAGDDAEAQQWIGPRTRVVDGHGRLVLAGFNDAHVHFLSGGMQLSRVDLRDAGTREEFARRIGEFAAQQPKGRWVLGGDWDHELWPGSPLPTKDLIDRYTPEVPVFVNRLDGHMALANSEALRRAGVTRDTREPDGGVIVRDAKTGEPTGILKDAAMNLVYRVVPAATVEEKLDAARAASRYAASFGVTSVQDMSAGADIGIYQMLHEKGELRTRIYAVAPLPEWENLGRVGVRAVLGSSIVRIGGLKGFADGSLGSTTALFFDAYNDAPATSGIPSDEMIPESRMLERIRNADRAGLQVMVHAIGDKANDRMLTLFETVARENGARDRRFRIEHAQHLRARDIPRFAADGVIASMQPYHAADDGRWAEKRIGPDRVRTTYAFRSLLEAGVRLAFGSDWTVAPLNPLLGLKAAVTRQTLDGKHPGGWVPEQKITIEEAIRAYTSGSAFAEFQDQEKGTIEAGKLADFVIWSDDILRIAPEKLPEVRADITVVGGRIVYER